MFKFMFLYPRIWENKDQNNSQYGHFLPSVYIYSFKKRLILTICKNILIQKSKLFLLQNFGNHTKPICG